MPAFHAESEESASLKMVAGGKGGGGGGAISGGSFSSAEPHLHVKLVHKGPPDSAGRGEGGRRLSRGGGGKAWGGEQDGW